MIAPSFQQTPDSVLQTEYYRPTDFVINFGKSEVSAVHISIFGTPQCATNCDSGIPQASAFFLQV
jgi:hypothetical protein